MSSIMVVIATTAIAMLMIHDAWGSPGLGTLRAGDQPSLSFGLWSFEDSAAAFINQ